MWALTCSFERGSGGKGLRKIADYWQQREQVDRQAGYYKYSKKSRELVVERQNIRLD